MTALTIRVATKADLAETDALFARSYPALLKADYPPSVLVTALPIISRAQPKLLATGTFFLAEIDGTIVGAGGWTAAAPGAGGRARGVAHVRHLVTDQDYTRRGVARALMTTVFETAASAGVTRMDCQSTRTAVPFYKAVGFKPLGDITVPLRPGIDFPAVAMTRQLDDIRSRSRP
ncbi:MAG: GNAT family N-acetyltransferase [Pseudomonadota bacterium]